MKDVQFKLQKQYSSILVKFQILTKESVVLEFFSLAKRATKALDAIISYLFKLQADVRFVIMRRIISSVVINIIAFLLRAKVFFSHVYVQVWLRPLSAKQNEYLTS